MPTLVTVPTLNVDDAVSDAFVDATSEDLNYLVVAGADLAAAPAGVLTVTNEFHTVTLVAGNNIDTITHVSPKKGQPLRLLFSNAQVMRNAGGGGNIRTLSGGDRAIRANEIITLNYDGALWREGSTRSGDLISQTQITSNVAFAAVTEATATTIITAPAFTADGVTSYDIELFSPAVEHTSSAQLSYHTIFVDGVSTGIGSMLEPGVIDQFFYDKKPMVLAAGSRTISWRAYKNTQSGIVFAGAGGAGVHRPSYLRITKTPN